MTLTTYPAASPEGSPRAGAWRRRRPDQPVHGPLRARDGRAPHQRRDLRFPLHRRRTEGARPGAGARAVLARRARAAHAEFAAAPRHRRQVDGRADGVAHRVAGRRWHRRPRVSRISAASARPARQSAATRTSRRFSERMLFVQGSRDAFGTAAETSRRCCRRSSTPTCTRSPAAITRSRLAAGRTTGSEESWTPSPRGFCQFDS